MNRPNSRRNLDIAIERIAGARDPLRLRRLMANAVVAQLLPDGVVKGGSALKLRFGSDATRFSTDLDAARTLEVEDYIKALDAALEEGWNGFTGTLVRKPQAHPAGVPQCYVMQPFDVKLSYNGKSWITVPLEVGHNEIGDAEDPDMVIPEELSRTFEELGFPALEPMPLMRLPYQVAQKLHGVSEKGSDRAHDLVDLQVQLSEGDVNLGETRAICARLFDYRGLQPWPPRIEKGAAWEVLYAEAAEGLGVIPDADEAVAWANELVRRIEEAG